MKAQGADVLIVDDEPNVGQLICQGLWRRGIKSVCERDASRAKHLLGRQTFAAAVVDAAAIGGACLIEHVREHCPGTAMILISGAAASGSGALQPEAPGCFVRPLDIDNICDTIQSAVNSHKGEAAQTSHSSPGLDGLTGLPTLRVLHDYLAERRFISISSRSNCSMILLNVDSFDEVNRLFGYAFGDHVLREVALQIQRNSSSLLVARCGNDEFAVLAPDVGEGEARHVAERFRELARQTTLSWKGHPITITVSIGVAESGAGFAMTESELLDRARRALMVAKRSGGNMVRSFSEAQAESEGAVALVTEEMSRLTEQSAKVNRRLRMTCLESVRALASAVEAKDPYTCQHSENVAYYAERLARYVGLPGNIVEIIRVASLVHDIGKIGIPDTVLTKPGKLTQKEFELIKQHPNIGANILEKISLLSTECHIVRHHHEQWNGSGYPSGLTGEEIPVGSRIINIADSIDAMLMRRTYKKPYSVEKVIYELKKGAGAQFEPMLAAAALEWICDNPDELILSQECAA